MRDRQEPSFFPVERPAISEPLAIDEGSKIAPASTKPTSAGPAKSRLWVKVLYWGIGVIVGLTFLEKLAELGGTPYERDVLQTAAENLEKWAYGSPTGGRIAYYEARRDGYFYVAKFTALTAQGTTETVFQCVLVTETSPGGGWVMAVGLPEADMLRDSLRDAIDHCRHQF